MFVMNTHTLHLLLSVLIEVTGGKIPLYIGGLFPMSRKDKSGWIGGPSTLPAVEMAIERINNNTKILPEYDIQLLWNDTKVCKLCLYDIVSK